MNVAVEGRAGLVAAPMFLVAFGVLGGPPTPSEAEAPQGIVPYLTDHRTQVFVAVVLIGLGSCLFAWYLAGLRRFVSPDDDASLGSAAMLGGLLAAAVVLVALCVLGGVVVHVPEHDLALLAFDAFNGLVTIGGFGFGFSVVLAAVAGRHSGTLDERLVAAGVAVGFVQLATIPGLWVESGFFAPLGAMPVLAFVLLTGWYTAVAWTMSRRSLEGGSP